MTEENLTNWPAYADLMTYLNSRYNNKEDLQNLYWQTFELQGKLLIIKKLSSIQIMWKREKVIHKGKTYSVSIRHYSKYSKTMKITWEFWKDNIVT